MSGRKSRKSRKSALPAVLVLGTLAAVIVLFFLLLSRLFNAAVGTGGGQEPVTEKFRIVREWAEKIREQIFDREDSRDSGKDREPEPGRKEDPDDDNNSGKNRDEGLDFGKELLRDLGREFGLDLDEYLTEEEQGITSGNFYNQGDFLLYDDMCFYSGFDGLYRSAGKELYDPEKIYRFSAEYMNYFDGAIYFPSEVEGGIVRMDPYSGETAVVYDAAPMAKYVPTTLYVYDSWFYFSNRGNLYRIPAGVLDPDSPASCEDAQLVVEDFNASGHVYASLCFARGKMIYNGTGGITAVDPDGSDPEVLSKQKANLFSDGKAIYCWWGTNNVCRIEPDGSTSIKYDLNRDDVIEKFSCCDGWLYYIVKADGIHELRRISTDGETMERIGGIGEPDDLIISLCTFPGEEYAYVCLFRKEDDKTTAVHEAIPLEE